MLESKMCGLADERGSFVRVFTARLPPCQKHSRRLSLSDVSASFLWPLERRQDKTSSNTRLDDSIVPVKFIAVAATFASVGATAAVIPL